MYKYRGEKEEEKEGQREREKDEANVQLPKQSGTTIKYVFTSVKWVHFLDFQLIHTFNNKLIYQSVQ